MALTSKDVKTRKDSEGVDELFVSVGVNGETVDYSLNEIVKGMADGSIAPSPEVFEAMQVLSQQAKKQHADVEKLEREQEAQRKLMEKMGEVIEPMLEKVQPILLEELGTLPKDFRVSLVSGKISLDIECYDKEADSETLAEYADKLDMRGINFSLNEEGLYEPSIKQGTRAEPKKRFEDGTYQFKDSENVGVPGLKFKVTNGLPHTMEDERTSWKEVLKSANVAAEVFLKDEEGNKTEQVNEERPWNDPSRTAQGLTEKVA